MLQHSLKMIWAERKSNGWILLELIVIFTILWFCSGFMYEKGVKFFEPVGVDINHTYLLRFNIRKNVNIEDYPKDYDYPQDRITIMERLKQYPAIENACFSNYNSPYSGSYQGRSLTKDSIRYPYEYREVSPEYFDVFKIKFQSGRPFDANEVLSKNYVVASPDADNKFYKEDITSLKEIINFELAPGHRVEYSVVGNTTEIGRFHFGGYRDVFFKP